MNDNEKRREKRVTLNGESHNGEQHHRCFLRLSSWLKGNLRFVACSKESYHRKLSPPKGKRSLEGDYHSPLPSPLPSPPSPPTFSALL
uniref:Uncharacterized protein n=1 Tax=Vespula pensylvanica TaxID=30213 RepID=A0A834JZ53_VESPE|nr:hypothetical protein H0235_016638 [Vespula pensylvanica]